MWTTLTKLDQVSPSFWSPAKCRRSFIQKSLLLTLVQKSPIFPHLPTSTQPPCTFPGLHHTVVHGLCVYVVWLIPSPYSASANVTYSSICWFTAVSERDIVFAFLRTITK